VGDIDFEVISATENSNKILLKNQILEGKKSVEDVVTLGPTAHATLIVNK
jgi:hypothetical protein